MGSLQKSGKLGRLVAWGRARWKAAFLNFSLASPETSRYLPTSNWGKVSVDCGATLRVVGMRRGASHHIGAPGEDTAVYVACSTLCFAKLALEDAFQTIREMHFPKADLAIHARGPHLTPAEVAADLGRTAQRLKAANVPLAAFHVAFDSGPHGAALQEQLRAVCRLARVSTVPLVTITAAPLGSDFQAEAARLRCWVKTATAEGVMLAVETHSETLTADPLGALELCRVVPGLVLTLDPSHYMVGPHAPINYDALFPLVRHVRLRDTTMNPPQFQVRVGQGEIEYGRIISQLERCGYDRALSVDVREEWSHSFSAAGEVRKLKYLLESLV